MKHIVIFNDHWCSGGVEALWTNLISSMPDKEDFKFTILVSQKETEIFDDTLRQNSVEILTVLSKVYKNPILRTFKNMQLFKSKLKALMPDILHINSCNASGLKYAYIAKKIGIKTVIVHSHNTNIEPGKFNLKIKAHLYWQKKYLNYPTHYFACSTEAGEFMFGQGKKMYILKNGVNLDKFSFNQNYRQEIRQKYNIKDEIIIGHIGRFCKQKNHMFLLEIFRKIHEIDNNTKLMCLGEGDLKNEFFSKVKGYGLENYVIDAGVTKEAYKYYQAFDAFILPSLHEGLPVVAVEAQSAGLPVFMADTITKESKILDSTSFFSLNDNVDEIANRIIKCYNLFNRKSVYNLIIEQGFDIKTEAEKLKKFYSEN